MSISVNLDAEVERRLREEAARKGLAVEEYLGQLLRRWVASGPEGSAPSAPAWETEWRAWAAGHRTLPSAADDDRDGIYGGRGE